LQNARDFDLGVDVQRVLRAVPERSAAGTPPSDRLWDEVLERVRTIPGIEAVALATSGPFSGRVTAGPVVINGRGPGKGTPVPIINAVTPEFFKTVGMAVRSGRTFTDADRVGTERIAIGNEVMAQYYWPDGDAVGSCMMNLVGTSGCIRVVGIVRRAREG